MIFGLLSLFAAAVAAAQVGDYSDPSKLKALIGRAESGDAHAQYELGTLYENGFWIQRNYPEAIRLYRLAANHGESAARESLGRMYFAGEGVERDFKEAARWFGCPAPAESILASCKEISYRDLPLAARELLSKMKCTVRTGSNYDEGSELNLDGKGGEAFQFCCTESPHGPCGAVVVAKVGADWKDITAKEGLLGFEGACNLFIPLESESGGYHDICLPDECSAGSSGENNSCRPSVWRFSDGRYSSASSPR